jgi:hypothetical protein
LGKTLLFPLNGFEEMFAGHVAAYVIDDIAMFIKK